VAVRLALDVSAVPPRLAGAGRYIGELARRVPTTGVATTLVTRRDDTLRWHDWSPSAHIASIVPNSRPARLLFEAGLAGRSATSRSVDVWHSPHYTMPRRSSTPTVVTIHDLTFFTNPEWHERSKVPFFRRAISYAATHANVLVTISEFTARQLDEQVPQHAPVVVATLGVDLERFNTDASDDLGLLRAHDFPTDRPYLFFLGTFEPRKGIDVLLEAFDQIAGHDSDVELWLAGQPGWGVKEIEARIAVHGARSRIRRLGFVDESVLPALLRQARAVVYPSRGEGFGLPVVEALACGARVVTSSDTVMSEIAGDAALLAPAGDALQLADAITKALTMSDDERAARARESRERAEIFTWDASVAQHVRAYEMAMRT
jgi:glycosyltransferase involved in cell wall biosynthesis